MEELLERIRRADTALVAEHKLQVQRASVVEGDVGLGEQHEPRVWHRLVVQRSLEQQQREHAELVGEALGVHTGRDLAAVEDAVGREVCGAWEHVDVCGEEGLGGVDRVRRGCRVLEPCFSLVQGGVGRVDRPGFGQLVSRPLQ